MSKITKIEWISLGLPKAMYKRIQKVIVFLGVPSVPEYVRQVCARELAKDELMKEINKEEPFGDGFTSSELRERKR